MIKRALTYDDIQLVPSYSEIKSRKDISLRTHVTRRYGLVNPIVGSPMDTVCDSEMAFALYKLGGVGCIHRFMSISEQVVEVTKLKSQIDSTVELEMDFVWGVMYDDWHTEIRQVPIMAAIGVSDSDLIRAKRLMDAGANIILIDVAHGHTKQVLNMIKSLKYFTKTSHQHVDIIAGNIATAEAAEDLQNAGADGLRVGIGSGSLCTTRIKTGFGVPSITCLSEIARVAIVPIMADGGIRTSGDITKAIAFGADCVMLGSLIAGTSQSPGERILKGSGLFKRYRGSASLETKTTHGQENRNIEGESTVIPFKGDVEPIIYDLLDGIRSGLSYCGASNISQFNPEYVEITNAGMIEAKPHLL